MAGDPETGPGTHSLVLDEASMDEILVSLWPALDDRVSRPHMLYCQ